MLGFGDITVKTNKETETFGSYEFAPLPKGYGYTLLNGFRRVLLSSLPGAAVTSVKVKDVKHEYSAMEGVQEDMIEILLNLKSVRFKSLSDDAQVCKIEVSGEKVVTAADIKVTGSVEVMNPEVVLAHLTAKDAKLSMEVVIEKGVGYRVAKEQDRSEIGRIPLDADFTPIKNVKLEVGKARKGQETELDSVLVEVTTDGSISPKEAVMTSAKIMQDFTGKVMVALGMSKAEVEELETNANTIVSAQPEQEEKLNNESMSIRIEDLAVSKRSKTGLLNGGYETVGDLLKITKRDLAKLPGFGIKSLNEVISMLEQYGIVLNEE
jgi:DNA-directed RNA polymerase subunit alpha